MVGEQPVTRETDKNRLKQPVKSERERERDTHTHTHRDRGTARGEEKKQRQRQKYVTEDSKHTYQSETTFINLVGTVFVIPDFTTLSYRAFTIARSFPPFPGLSQRSQSRRIPDRASYFQCRLLALSLSPAALKHFDEFHFNGNG